VVILFLRIFSIVYDFLNILEPIVIWKYFSMVPMILKPIQHLKDDALSKPAHPRRRRDNHITGHLSVK
jgi:hypothetical protein